jgi:hypothetical protein
VSRNDNDDGGAWKRALLVRVSAASSHERRRGAMRDRYRLERETLRPSASLNDHRALALAHAVKRSWQGGS